MKKTKARSEVLPLDFYRRDTTTVARELLGQVLVRELDDGTRLAGRIVETEAYLGITDRACHTFGGRRTQRTSTMYLDGGHAYIYFIYGMYDCFNVVTQSTEEPEAVLIRALEPLENTDVMLTNRRDPKREIDVTNGPGKLCQALAITRSLNGHLLSDSPLYIEQGVKISETAIVSTTRVGIAYAEEAVHWPLRFYVNGSKYVSKR